ELVATQRAQLRIAVEALRKIGACPECRGVGGEHGAWRGLTDTTKYREWWACQVCDGAGQTVECRAALAQLGESQPAAAGGSPGPSSSGSTGAT
ncbi:MAG TPA: hypothetical protein VE987_08215, partial [Polyangiaceae bacterium]|nr:hypothetical protein [Polyangiaceae bacterium]